MCYIISSIGKSGRRHVVDCNGVSLKDAKIEAALRRREAMKKEHDNFEAWAKILLRHAEFSVDARDIAKRFASFLMRARIDFYTLPESKYDNGFITFKLA